MAMMTVCWGQQTADSRQRTEMICRRCRQDSGELQEGEEGAADCDHPMMKSRSAEMHVSIPYYYRSLSDIQKVYRVQPFVHSLTVP